MSESAQSDQKATVFGIVTRPSKSEVLMQPNGRAYTLPSFTMDGGNWQTGAAEVTPGFREILGDDVNVLYRARFSEDEMTNTNESLFVIEDNAPASNGCCWIRLNDLEQVTLARPEMRSIISTSLRQAINGRIPAHRPPWARHGWFDSATQWIAEKLKDRGISLQGSIEPVKKWSLSCVLQVPTSMGKTYFKAGVDLPLFVNETSLISELGRLYPGPVPATIAADPVNRWMLMKDFGEPVGWGAPVELRKDVLSQFAGLQQKSARDIDTLLKIGCLDRRLEMPGNGFDNLLNSPEVHEALMENELEELAGIGPRLSELGSRLKEYNLPETLVHGDLHGGNVAKGDSQLVFFDWTDACIAHPFFDMLEVFLEKDEAVYSQMRDYYLSQWIGYETMDRLLEAWKVASVLAALHHAISYQTIVANIEAAARHELDWGVAFWLRRMLKLIEK